jgi:hypothetical protein
MDKAFEQWRRRKPSPKAWTELLSLLDGIDDASWPAVLAEAEAALAAWPDRLRAATAGGWAAVQEGAPPRWWPLVRHLALAGLDQLAPDDPDEPDHVGGAIAGLTSLAVGTAYDLWPLDALAGMPLLTTLDLSGLEHLTDLAAIPVLPRLRELVARGCPHLSNLAGLARQPALAAVDLARSPRALSLATLPPLPALRVLHLDACLGVDDLAPLTGARGLEQLYLTGCERLSDLTPLVACRELRVLDLRLGAAAPSLAPLAGLTTLRRIWLERDLLAALDPLAGLAVDELYLSRGATIALAPVGRMPALRDLVLADVTGPIDLAALAGSSIEELTLARCPQAEPLAALAGLPRLRKLVIEGRPGLHDLDFAAGLTGLIEVHASACPDLTDVRGLSGLPDLRLLNITGSPVASGLDGLSAVEVVR